MKPKNSLFTDFIDFFLRKNPAISFKQSAITVTTPTIKFR